MGTPQAESNVLNELRSETWKGHVVVMPWPAQGHVNPMMHLSFHLAAHGVLVTFVNVQFNHDRILQARAAGSPRTQAYSDFIAKGNIRLVGIPDGLGYDEYVADFSVAKQAQALIDLEPSLVKLVEGLQPPVTCIIADAFVISTPAVALRFNIPHVTFWTQSATSYAAHVFLTQNHASFKEYLAKLLRKGKVDERVISHIPTCPTMSYNELPTFLKPCDPSDFVFSYLIKTFQRAPNNAFVLMNTFEALEAPSLSFIRMPNMLSIGPLVPSHFILDDTTQTFDPKSHSPPMTHTSFWVEDEEGCLPWLNRQNPSTVLYVSLGSITIISTQQVSELSCGLEASGCPFLMVVRPVMLVGAASVTFPDGFVERMRESGKAIFVAWAPQLKVLAHPAIGGFLTHAGWNSTLESICRGVPMLCWPYFADQMLNARCIVDIWKIGLDFALEEVANDKDRTSNDGGDNREETISTCTEQESNQEMLSFVKHDEIEKTIRQLMDPFSSVEIRKRIDSLRQASKMAYESSSSSNFKSLLKVISY